jgi:hypothetical protein
MSQTVVQGGEVLFLNGAGPPAKDSQDLLRRGGPDIDPVIGPERLLERRVGDFQLVLTDLRVDCCLLQADFIEAGDESAIRVVAVQHRPHRLQPLHHVRLQGRFVLGRQTFGPLELGCRRGQPSLPLVGVVGRLQCLVAPLLCFIQRVLSL